MSAAVKAAFELQTLQLPLAKLLPTKKLEPSLKASVAYRRIVSSVAAVGLIEPLLVYRQRGGTYLVLDGHARLEVVKDLGHADVACIPSTDDEGFTYNKHVQRMNPIQANKMILKALDAGVSEERLAKALNLAGRTIRDSRALLTDICPEAVELLKDKHVGASALRVFKKAKPLRQIEMAELMCAANTFTLPYALALLRATPDRSHVTPPKRETETMRPEDLARMEAEMQGLERDVLLLDDSYGRNVVNLTIARGYVKKLLDNGKIVQFLTKKFPDLFAEFQRIQEATSLEG
jgi:hypothetical protein